MESVLSFVTKFTDVVRNHMSETSELLGKEIVSSDASKSGICVDKIKIAYGAKFSMLGHKYSDADLKKIEKMKEDTLVCQGKEGYFFVPVSEIRATGGSVILVDGDLKQPEVNGGISKMRRDVFRKFKSTRKSIKKMMPEAQKKKKKRKINIFS